MKLDISKIGLILKKIFRSQIHLFLLFGILLFCVSNMCEAQSSEPSLPTVPYSNSVNFNDNLKIYEFTYQGADGSLKYIYDASHVSNTGSFNAIECVVENSFSFRPSYGGGLATIYNGQLIYPYEMNFERIQITSSIQNRSVETIWRMYNDNISITYHFIITMSGRTLTMEIIGEDPNTYCSGIFFDRCENAINVRNIYVPYLPYTNILYSETGLAYPKSVFTSLYTDWEKSNASQVIQEDSIYSNSSSRFAGHLLYNPLTNGKRNTVNETTYLTVSPSLSDVFPDLSNPVSWYRSVVSEYLIFDMVNGSPNAFWETRDFILKLRQSGIENIWLINHVWQRGGYDMSYPDTTPADDKYGGEIGLKALSEATTNSGYLFSLHENYYNTHYYPTNASYVRETVALDGSGKYIESDVNCEIILGIGEQCPEEYVKSRSRIIKPFFASTFLNMYAPEIHSTYFTTASFLDVHSSVDPWGPVDYDCNVPNAGKFTEVIKTYRSLAGYMRLHHSGPVSGEGKFHFMYAGYFDDIEAQIHTGKQNNRNSGKWLPLLVDFDLLKMHNKFLARGVGYYPRFFCLQDGGWDSGLTYTIELAKAYIAAELAYGHGGFVFLPSLDYIVLEYKHVLSAQKLYANANPVSISYNDNGQEVNVSEYISRHPTTFDNIDHYDFMSQVRVVYDNGVVVCANRHPSKSWNVTVGNPGGWFNYNALTNGNNKTAVEVNSRTQYLLPPLNGWVVYSPTVPVQLSDAITVLQHLTGIKPTSAFALPDVNADSKIGLQEALFILDYVAGLR